MSDAEDQVEPERGARGHVHRSMRQFLEIDGRIRVDRCWNRIWVQTSWTKRVFDTLQERVNAHASTKPWGAVITGAPDTGKSATMKRFRDLNPPVDIPGREYAEHAAVYMIAPDKLNRAGFYKSILKEIGFPILYNANETDLRNHMMAMLRDCHLGTLMIDELHDIARDVTGGQAVEYLRFIKGLVNESGRPFVVGGDQVVLDLLASEKQMVGRFDDVVTMAPFTEEEFVTVLLAYEKLLPLRRPSRIREDPGLVELLYSVSDGYIGRLSRSLNSACKAAIDNGDERLTAVVVEQSADRSLGNAIRKR